MTKLVTVMLVDTEDSQKTVIVIPHIVMWDVQGSRMKVILQGGSVLNCNADVHELLLDAVNEWYGS